MPAAFAEARAFQCGYCTPGMVLTASSLLRELARPSDDEIADALGGNLCRCGCYVKITKPSEGRGVRLVTYDAGDGLVGRSRATR